MQTGEEGGGALAALVAWFPGGLYPSAQAGLTLLCSVSPQTPGRAWIAGWVHARGVCRGHFSFGTKCLRDDKGLPCPVRVGGRELSQSPVPASGSLKSHREQ